MATCNGSHCIAALGLIVVLCFTRLSAAGELEALDPIWADSARSAIDRDCLRIHTLYALGVLLSGERDCRSDPAALETRLQHPYLSGALGELGLHKNLQRGVEHARLRNAPGHAALIDLLQQALGQGLITGYDLRPRAVFTHTTRGYTLVYSHSSTAHLQELVALLAGHGLAARVYVAPKIAAFLYREEWGGDGEHVTRLPGGLKVIAQPEMVVLFEFDAPDIRTQFHRLVRRYAKRDAAQQSTLLTDAWWQPFYYADTPLADFVSIDLLILPLDSVEVTLTVPAQRREVVSAWAEAQGFAVQSEQVWVNPSFHRFLHGGYK